MLGRAADDGGVRRVAQKVEWGLIEKEVSMRRELLVRWGVVCVFSMLLVSVGSAAAGEFKYPEKPVNILVGYAAGGSTDLIARALADDLSKKWSSPMTVINKPGASGTTALLEVKGARPDGYTMLMQTNAGVSNPALEPSLPYKWDELTYVLRIVTSPLVVTVKGDGSFRTFGDLVAELKKDPAQVKLGLAGSWGAGLFGTVQLGQAAGFDPSKVIRVVMTGGNQVVASVAGGHVDYGIQYLSEVIELVKGGKLRALGVVNSARVAPLPDIPTMKELGFEQVNWQPWVGVAGPTGVRKEITEAWNKAVKELIADPGFLKKVENLGFTPAYLGPEDFKGFADRFYKTALEVKKQLPQ
jgi:tripartite-type tricarboxylate transporter receptor subunit TctC